MSSKFFKPFNKVMGVIGLVDEDDYDDDDDDEMDDEMKEQLQPEVINNKKNKIVSIKTNTFPKLVLKKPVEFQDIMEIIDSIKTRKIVVMNMTEVEPRLAQRMIDYIVGGCYALNGEFEEITKSIYLVAPDNVEISNELKQELNRTGFFSFNDR